MKTTKNFKLTNVLAIVFIALFVGCANPTNSDSDDPTEGDGSGVSIPLPTAQAVVTSWYIDSNKADGTSTTLLAPESSYIKTFSTDGTGGGTIVGDTDLFSVMKASVVISSAGENQITILATNKSTVQTGVIYKAELLNSTGVRFGDEITLNFTWDPLDFTINGSTTASAALAILPNSTVLLRGPIPSAPSDLNNVTSIRINRTGTNSPSLLNGYDEINLNAAAQITIDSATITNDGGDAKSASRLESLTLSGNTTIRRAVIVGEDSNGFPVASASLQQSDMPLSITTSTETSTIYKDEGGIVSTIDVFEPINTITKLRLFPIPQL